LRFAIAAAANPEILLIDEALSTGDASFKERSDRKMAELRERAGTMFLVSHAPQSIEEMCTRAIWLHRGSVILDGPAFDTTRTYRRWAAAVSRGDELKARDHFEAAIAQGVARSESRARVPKASMSSEGNEAKHVRSHV
jgi:teichoic acid transport system ATP-binding protein